MKATEFGIGLAGIVIGAICLAVLFGVEVYGPDSYTTSGSGELRVGESYSETNSPLLPQIARAAFYTFVVPLFLSAASFARREIEFVSWGALVIGLSPLLIYTAGIVVTAVILFAIGLPIVGGLVKRKYAET